MGDGLTAKQSLRSADSPAVHELAHEATKPSQPDRGIAASEAARAKASRRANVAKRATQARALIRGRFIWPVVGPVTSRFGRRVSPITGTREFHHGTDLACKRGQRLRAPKGGRVILAKYYGIYGRSVKIRHKGGWVSFTTHMSRLSVRRGRRVTQGQFIGRCGSSGWATGAHIHFELRNPKGRVVDPVRHTWPRMRRKAIHLRNRDVGLILLQRIYGPQVELPQTGRGKAHKHRAHKHRAHKHRAHKHRAHKR